MFQAKSWWIEEIARTIKVNNPLADENSADVAIIGGGFTGLSSAIHLKEINPTLDVALLESDYCGHGASGRNGGFSMTLFGLTKGITKFRFGTKKTVIAHQYMEEAVDYLDAFIGKHKLKCDYEKSGYLLVATSKAQIKRLEHEFKLAENLGLQGIERWERDRLAGEFKTDSYKLGWFEPRCGILQPAKLAQELKRLAEKKGVRIYENSPVLKLKRGTDKNYIVTTEKGTMQSEYLIAATNAYSVLLNKIKSKQVPVFTHIALTEPLSATQLKSIGWKNRCGIEDARDFIHYYRLTADNRIAMGGGDVTVTFGKNMNKDRNEKIFKLLHEQIVKVFPQLKGIKITHTWGGPVSITMDMAPGVGYLDVNKKGIYSVGCMGHGVSMTMLNGKTFAEMICGKKTKNTEIFFMNRTIFPWPPEPLKSGITHGIRGLMKFEDAVFYK